MPIINFRCTVQRTLTRVGSYDSVAVLPPWLLVVERLVEDPEHGQEVERQQGVVDHVEDADLHWKSQRKNDIRNWSN